MALVLLYFLPLYGAPAYRLPSSPPDVCEFVWSIWHQQRWLASAAESFYASREVFHPVGASLLLHAMAEGITIPLVLLLGDSSPARIYSLCCIICFAANYLAGLYLFRALSTSLAAASIAALIMTLHPFFLNHLAAGHLNFLCFFPFLLALGALFRLLDGKSSKLWLLLFASAALLPFYNLYYFYFFLLAAAFLIPLSVVCRLVELRRTAIPVLAILLALAVSAPKLFMIGALRASGTYTADHNSRRHSADLAHFILPAEQQILQKALPAAGIRQRLHLHTGEAGLYFPVSLVLLLATAFFGRSSNKKRLLVFSIAGLLFLVLSFGPEFQVFGSPGWQNGFFKLLRRLPAFPSVPARFGIIALLLLLCACLTSLNLNRRRVGAGIVCLALLELWPRPLQTTDLPPSPVLAYLAGLDGIAAIHDAAASPQLAMYRQTFHGKPITRAFLSRRPRAALGIYKRNVFIAFMEKGRAAPLLTIRSSWRALNAQAVIAEKGQTEMIKRLQSIPWFEKAVEDEDLVLFVEKRPSGVLEAGEEVAEE